MIKQLMVLTLAAALGIVVADAAQLTFDPIKRVDLVQTQNTEDNTITLTPEECDQVAQDVATKGEPKYARRSDMTPNSRIVADYVFDHNPEITKIPPEGRYNLLMEACFAAQGQTEIPAPGPAHTPASGSRT